jgi:hypothetical protein
MKKKRNKQSPFDLNLRILVEVAAVILVWRGMWILADRYLVPESPDVSAVISILLGIIILFVERKSLKDLK